MAVDAGWESVLTGELPLAESVVQSLDDKISILPIGGPTDRVSELLSTIHASVTAGVLRYHYDFVLLDLGNLERQSQARVAMGVVHQCRLDATLIITNQALDDAAPSLVAATGG